MQLLDLVLFSYSTLFFIPLKRMHTKGNSFSELGKIKHNIECLKTHLKSLVSASNILKRIMKDFKLKGKGNKLKEIF